jgi:hypothetical protein
MRRLKRSTAFLQRSRNCLRGDRASPTRRDFARIKLRERAARCAEDSALYSSLVKSENFRLACGDLVQINVATRDIRVMPTMPRLALLSCDGTQAQECEDYRYNRCHDRFGREFHGNHVFCSDAFIRRSLHPPPKLNEAMLYTRNGSCLRYVVRIGGRQTERKSFFILDGCS